VLQPERTQAKHGQSTGKAQLSVPSCQRPAVSRAPASTLQPATPSLSSPAQVKICLPGSLHRQSTAVSAHTQLTHWVVAKISGSQCSCAWPNSMHGPTVCMAQQYAWPNSVHGQTVCMAQQCAWPSSMHGQTVCMAQQCAWPNNVHGPTVYAQQYA